MDIGQAYKQNYVLPSHCDFTCS